MDIKSPLIRLFSCSLLAFASPVISSEIASVVGEFEEHFSKEVPVSGNVVAGLMLVPSLAAAKQNFAPYIQLPASSDKPQVVCLSVVSQDGVYSSHNSYQVPINSSGKDIQADYSQSAHNELLSQSNTRIALKAQPGQCGQTQPNKYLIASNGRVEGAAELFLMIDSLGATDVQVAARGTDRKIVRGQCQTNEGERKTGFDYACRLPIALDAGEKVQVKIQRLRFGRKMPAISLTIDG